MLSKILDSTRSKPCPCPDGEHCIRPRVHLEDPHRLEIPIVISRYKHRKPTTVNRSTERPWPFGRRRDDSPIRAFAVCRWIRKKRAIRQLKVAKEKEKLRLRNILRREREIEFIEQLQRQEKYEIPGLDNVKPRRKRFKLPKLPKNREKKEKKVKKEKKLWIEKEETTPWIEKKEKKEKKKKIKEPKLERETTIVIPKPKTHRSPRIRIKKEKKSKEPKIESWQDTWYESQIETKKKTKKDSKKFSALGKSTYAKPKAETKVVSVKRCCRQSLSERFVNCIYRCCCQLYCYLTILVLIGLAIILLI